MARRQTPAVVEDHQDDLAQAVRSVETSVCIAEYLKTHRPNRDRPTLDFLIADDERLTWMVRWPNGSLKWETAVGLAARGFRVPAHPLIEHGAFVDPSLAREVAAALERR